jgi:hypothetical protein
MRNLNLFLKNMKVKGGLLEGNESLWQERRGKTGDGGKGDPSTL